jgi:hypothetical protein
MGFVSRIFSKRSLTSKMITEPVKQGAVSTPPVGEKPAMRVFRKRNVVEPK